jgi:uncharacterized protein YbaA (DUF1428 family)
MLNSSIMAGINPQGSVAKHTPATQARAARLTLWAQFRYHPSQDLDSRVITMMAEHRHTFLARVLSAARIIVERGFAAERPVALS